VLERARPVLDPLAKQIFHVGDLGSGAVMKLAVNVIVHGLNLALGEALVLAERAGVDRTTAYEVFANSAIAAPFVHYKRQAFEHPGEVPVAFSLDLVSKDLDLILALAAQADAPMEQAAINNQVVKAAVAAGLGDRDLSELASYLRSGPSAGG
jgi:3-hydroxyisobutyrate dehydrogenase-like beta-hydroxyacid dehydrogenase